MSKTTQKQFEIFQEEVNKWVDMLGLYEWDVHVSIDEMNAHGQCQFDLVNRKAIVELSDELQKTNALESEIRLCALHEVLHILIGKLYIMSRNRKWNDEEYTEEEHVVINRLIKVLQ